MMGGIPKVDMNSPSSKDAGAEACLPRAERNNYDRDGIERARTISLWIMSCDIVRYFVFKGRWTCQMCILPDQSSYLFRTV